MPFVTLAFALHREVAKAVKLHKAKTVVVAPNIEQIESEGGLDDLLGSILKQAEDFGLPVVFALSRKKMGQVWVGLRAGCLACLPLIPWFSVQECIHRYVKTDQSQLSVTECQVIHAFVE